MYTPEEFDKKKTKVMEYILYKKRAEVEVRRKFANSIEENMLNDIIEYVKEAGYINDSEYVKKAFEEYMKLKTMSIREIKSKIYAKGIEAYYIEDYISENREALEEYELKSAEKLMEKKKRTADENKIKLYLLNKGFDPDTVNKLEF